MWARRRTALFLLIICLTSSQLQGATAAGRSSTSPVNTILNGKGAPKSSLGINGDFYIDTRSLLLYGPKSKGKWPTPQSLQGPTGPSGSDGKNGADGKVSSNTNVSGVTGPQGPQGLPGPQGEKGDPGLPGAVGAAGLPGAPGPAGVNGSSGSPGVQGATGATGASGPPGAKGETGAVGPSEVTVVDIPQFTLGTSVGFSFAASDTFAVLMPNSSYKFDIHIRASSNILDLVLGADLLAAGGVLQFSYIRTDFRSVTYTTSPATYGFLISGTIRTSGAASSLVLRVIDAYGDSGAAPLIFSGKAYITLVGAIK
jgi:hypothetical protein